MEIFDEVGGFNGLKFLVPSNRFQSMLGTPEFDLRQLALVRRKSLKYSAVCPPPTENGGVIIPRK